MMGGGCLFSPDKVDLPPIYQKNPKNKCFYTKNSMLEKALHNLSTVLSLDFTFHTNKVPKVLRGA